MQEAILFGNYKHFGAKAIFRANEHANLLGVSLKNRAGGKIRVVITRVLRGSSVDIMRFTQGSLLTSEVGDRAVCRDRRHHI